jgi:hypothetical protein
MNLCLDIWYDTLDGGSACRKATTYTGQHNAEKRRNTFMPRAGIEPTIPEFERSKIVRTSDRAATGTGIYYYYYYYYYVNCLINPSLIGYLYSIALCT